MKHEDDVGLELGQQRAEGASSPNTLGSGGADGKACSPAPQFGSSFSGPAAWDGKEDSVPIEQLANETVMDVKTSSEEADAGDDQVGDKKPSSGMLVRRSLKSCACSRLQSS